MIRRRDETEEIAGVWTRQTDAGVRLWALMLPGNGNAFSNRSLKICYWAVWQMKPQWSRYNLTYKHTLRDTSATVTLPQMAALPRLMILLRAWVISLFVLPSYSFIIGCPVMQGGRAYKWSMQFPSCSPPDPTPNTHTHIHILSSPFPLPFFLSPLSFCFSPAHLWRVYVWEWLKWSDIFSCSVWLTVISSKDRGSAGGRGRRDLNGVNLCKVMTTNTVVPWIFSSFLLTGRLLVS